MAHNCKAPPDSLVLDSIHELIALERAHLSEIEAGEKKRRAQEDLSRLAREHQAREERDQSLRAASERQHAEALRCKMRAALAEAARESVLVRQRLEQEHRVRMARLAEEHASSIQYWKEDASRTRRYHPAVLAALVLSLVGAFGVLFFFSILKPSRDAEEVLRQAAVAAASDEPAMWDEATRLVALAKTKDRGNFAAIGVEETIAKKRAAQNEKDAADRKKAAESVVKLQQTLVEKKKSEATPTQNQMQHHDRRKAQSAGTAAWGQPMPPSS
jgi:hypothetical protein